MKYLSVFLVSVLFLVGCYENEVSCPVTSDAGPPVFVDAELPAPSPCPENPWLREDDFSVHVLTPIVELRPGTETTILVCVERGARFEEPVILLNSWAPEYVWVEVRENRPEDADGVTAIRVRTVSLEASGGESPGEFRVPRMSFSAISDFNLSHAFTVDFTVGPAEF